MLMEAVLVAIILVFSALFVLSLMYQVAAGRNKVPPVFTPPEALDQVVEALDLPERGRFYDLGCGDGRVLDAVAQRRPKLQVVGVENNPVLVRLARMRLQRRAEVKKGQIEDTKFDGVERAFVYLGPGLMALLEPRFERELPRGARVVSQQFALPKRKPDRVLELSHGKPYAKTLYIYDY